MKKILFFITFLLSTFLVPPFPAYASAWTVSSQPVLNVGPSGTSDSNVVGAPSVMYHNGQYEMWYTGSDGNLGKLGLATSSDGVT